MMVMMNDTALDLAGRLKAARLLRGLDQQQIAERLGVARTTVSTWERGATEPSVTHFVAWAEITGQPLDWFADGVVRPKGLEPLTFWLGAWTAEDDAMLRSYAEAVTR